MPVYNHARHISHFDLDCFFVSVEILMRPDLKGKPVLVGGGSERGVVAACSYEARKFGVHSAMPMYQAKRLCPHAILVHGDYDTYSKYSRLVREVVSDTVPLFEQASIDEFYIDMSGMDKFFGCYQFTKELETKVLKETGLPISWGLASNKLLSKVSTNEVKPSGRIQIAHGNEKSYLAPLNVIKIPGVGLETANKFYKRGVELVGTLSEMSVRSLTTFLGKPGLDLHRKANGIDESPVVPYSEQKSISTEATYDKDTIDIHFLHAELIRMVEKIAFEMRTKNLLTGCVTVKLKYSDFTIVNKQLTISYTNSDHVLMKVAKELFARLFERRILVRLLGIKFSHLIPGNHQIDLFEDTQESIKLYQAIDSIKHQYGLKAVMRAAGV